MEHFIERDLKRRVPRLPGRGEIFYRARLGVGRVADHLLEIAESERCDLVVVGSHGRAGLARLWSVSATTLHLARMAVLVVPDGTEEVVREDWELEGRDAAHVDHVTDDLTGFLEGLT